MGKHFKLHKITASVLTAIAVCFSIFTDPAAAEIPAEINPAFSWELPPPVDSLHSQAGTVVYRAVHETVYASSPLYVRSGPGNEFDIIGRLSVGEVVRRGAVGNNGWSQILYRNQEAYVNSTYLSVSPMIAMETYSDLPFTPANDMISAQVLTKLRSGPGPQYAVAGHLNPGDRIHRAAIGKNGWSKVIFHDTEVYACTAAFRFQSSDSSAYYDEMVQQVKVMADTPIWPQPGFHAQASGFVPCGTILTQTAADDNGWSRILYDGKDTYIPTGYLSGDLDFESPRISVKGPERPTDNAPFVCQYLTPPNEMPHALFTPVNAEPGKPLPLIISLHGALEIGETSETLMSNFITKEIRNWEYTGLQGFDAYVVCPQLTGLGLADTWCSQKSADNLFSLIDYLKDNYPIDETKIILEGHSLGGQGVLYMAADERACFSAIVPVSAYDPGISCQNITAKVRGYSGSPYIHTPREDWTSYHFMADLFENIFGLQNWLVKSCSHYDIPTVALEEDLDGNGQSDLIEWMLAQ